MAFGSDDCVRTLHSLRPPLVFWCDFGGVSTIDTRTSEALWMLMCCLLCVMQLRTASEYNASSNVLTCPVPAGSSGAVVVFALVQVFAGHTRECS